MQLVSLAPSNTEILYALGLGDQIVGITGFCDYPADAKRKPKVGGWTTPLPEKIRTLRPDLIFTCYFLPPELRDWKGPGKIIHVAPKTLHGVYLSIMTIAVATNTEKKGKEIVKKMKQEFAQIRKNRITLSLEGRGKGEDSNKAIKQFNNRSPRVYMEEWLKPPMVSGNWVPELVEIAGGIEQIAEKGKPSREFDFKELQDFDPDLMIFHWCGFGKRFYKKNVIERSGWSQLRAVKNDRLFPIDDALLNRPGPRLLEGAKQIQEILINLV
ncbi:MAG: cobalamin-binding protein [Candidatus Levybacteria bacterium]|nr:cobalamin-binding protein [Candidatus Levybacteria bacterium]